MYVHAVGRKCIPVAVNVAQQLQEDSRVAEEASSKVLKVETYSQAVDIRGKYRVTKQLVPKVVLISTQKLRFSFSLLGP